MSHHEHPNATLIRETTEAMYRGDMSAVVNVLADDVEWHEIGRAEPIVGKAALAERYGSTPADYGDFSGHVHDVVANDDHVVALVETTVRRGDRSFTYRTAEIFHVRDGKITERWAFAGDTGAINEFFAGF